MVWEKGFKNQSSLSAIFRSPLPTGPCAFALSAMMSVALAACSPGIGATPSNIPNYQPINVNCQGMEVSSSTLDVPTLRSLVHCFNSYGSLAPIDEMTQSLSDSDLQPMADALSQYLFANPQTLYELDQSYSALYAQGLSAEFYQAIHSLFQNDQFVVSSLALLRDAYYQQPSAVMSLFKSASVDPNFLTALNYLSKYVNPANAATGIDAGLTAAVAPSFTSLQTKFRPASTYGNTLRQMTDTALAYMQGGGANAVPVGQMALQGLIRGDLFVALDEAIGGPTSQNLQQGIDQLSSVIKVPLQGSGDMFSGMASLFSAMNGPLVCLKGTQTVANGDMLVMSELSNQVPSAVQGFMQIMNPLTLITVNPLCNNPPELVTYYPSMDQFAGTSAMIPSAALMKALYRPVITDSTGSSEHPLAQLLIGLMADPAIQGSIPLMTELNSRGIWNDVLLLATIPPVEDRASVSGDLQVLQNPIPGLTGQDGSTLYDILHNAMAKMTPDDFYALAQGIEQYTGSDTPVLRPLLQTARDFYYLNDTHPLVDTIQHLFADAPNKAGLFNLMFKSTQLPQFQKSIQLISAMAEDGRLRQVLEAMLTMYRKYSAGGTVAIAPTIQPIFAPYARHSLDDTDLLPYPITTSTPSPTDPCANLNLAFGVDQFTTDPNYNQDLNNTVNCIGEYTGDPSVEQSIDFLRDTPTGINGWNYFELPIQMVEQMDLTQPALQYISSAWLNDFDSGLFFNTLNACPFLISDTIDAVPGSSEQFASGPLLRPLFDMAAPLVTPSTLPSLDYVEKFAATQATQSDFPQTLAFVHGVWGLTPEPVYSPVVANVDLEHRELWVKNKECENIKTPADVPRIADEVVDDFDNRLDNWSLQNGQPRRDWSFGEFQQDLAQTIQKLGDPSLDDPSETLQQALLNSMRYFSLAPGQAPNQTQHYQPQDLINWFKSRSDDYRLMTIYETDENGNFEDNPRVVLMNSVDRLEMIMIAGDFTVNELGIQIAGDASLQYSAELALAWGDLDRSLWPANIQQMFPPGTPIKKLSDVVNDMMTSQLTAENVIGFPILPNCKMTVDPNDPPSEQQLEGSWPKTQTGISMPDIGPIRNIQRNLFNMNEVFSVLLENEPGQNPAQYPNTGGLELIRDLMYELYFSTPSQYRGYTMANGDLWRNNLDLGVTLSRMGFLRMIAQKLRSFQGNEPDLLAAFQAITNGSQAPQTGDALTSLFVHDRGQTVFWSVLQGIFNVFDSGEGNYTPAEQQQLAALGPAAATAQKQEWVEEAARMRQLGYYSLGLGQNLNLTAPLMTGVKAAVDNYAGLISSNEDKIESWLLRSDKASYLMRSIFESKDTAGQGRFAAILTAAFSDPKLVDSGLALLNAESQLPESAWTLFSDRWDALTGVDGPTALSTAFAPYHQYLTTVGDNLITFFSDLATDPTQPNSTTPDPDAVQAADLLRGFFGKILTDGEVDQLLILAQKDPDQFYQVMGTLSKYIQSGQLQNFFTMVRNSLSTPSH